MLKRSEKKEGFSLIITEQGNLVLKLYKCIREVVGSNRGRDTDGVLLWFSSVPEGKLCNSTSFK
jgi:hypothetical protein